MSRSSARCSSSCSGPIPFLAATACETYASPRFSTLELEAVGQQRAPARRPRRSLLRDRGPARAGRPRARASPRRSDPRPRAARRGRAIAPGAGSSRRAPAAPAPARSRARRRACGARRVRRQRLGLAARAVEREHQLRTRAARAADGARTSISSSATSSELASCARVRPRSALRARRAAGPRAAGSRPARSPRAPSPPARAAPERQRLAQQLRTLRRLRRTRFADAVLETGEVELAAVELEHVPGRPGLEEAGPEQLPQLGDRVLQRRRSQCAADARPRAGRPAAPSRSARSPAGGAGSGARAGSGRRAAPAFPRRAPRAGRGCGIPALPRL